MAIPTVQSPHKFATYVGFVLLVCFTNVTVYLYRPMLRSDRVFSANFSHLTKHRPPCYNKVWLRQFECITGAISIVTRAGRRTRLNLGLSCVFLNGLHNLGHFLLDVSKLFYLHILMHIHTSCHSLHELNL